MNRKGFFLSVCGLMLAVLVVFSAGVEASVIPVTRFRSLDLTAGAPAGWAVEKKVGVPALGMIKDRDYFYLHLVSNGNSSFGVRTSAQVNVRDYPILSWRWRVDKMPIGGDVRKKSTDDQALQVYVAFKETGFPAALNTPVIGYIWDSEAPKGWSGRSSQIGGDKMRYIVLRNKSDRTGLWYIEHRNIYEDYKKLFGDINNGEPPGVTTGLQVHINTQRTKTPAEGMIGDIYFSRETKDVATTEAAKEKMVARTVVISLPKRKSVAQSPAGISMAGDFNGPGCLNISVVFDTDSAVVSVDQAGQMRPLLKYLIEVPGAKLAVTGHADGVGPAAYNKDLSMWRARSVRDYLVQKFNIDAGRLIVSGVGSSQPVADNDTPDGRAQNRRVMIQGCPEKG